MVPGKLGVEGLWKYNLANVSFRMGERWWAPFSTLAPYTSRDENQLCYGPPQTDPAPPCSLALNVACTPNLQVSFASSSLISHHRVSSFQCHTDVEHCSCLCFKLTLLSFSIIKESPQSLHVCSRFLHFIKDLGRWRKINSNLPKITYWVY